MTDWLKGCWVAFERDIRVDDAEPLLDAIRRLRGVADVTISVAKPEDWLNRTRVRAELVERLYAALDDKEQT